MLVQTVRLVFAVQLCSETGHLSHIYDAILSVKEKDAFLPPAGGQKAFWGYSIPPEHLSSANPTQEAH